MLPKLFAHLRTALGDEVQLLHDVHERVQLAEAINLCKALEPYNLFFLEDPFPPEDNAWFRQLRQHTSIPIAMGELFNTVQEYLPLISERLIEFIRIHISQIGGLTPARKVAALSEFFGVRTAWHGPGDASLSRMPRSSPSSSSTYNFGIHEGGAFPPDARGVQGLARAEGRVHGGQRLAWPWRRGGRGACREVPDSRRVRRTSTTRGARPADATSSGSCAARARCTTSPPSRS